VVPALGEPLLLGSAVRTLCRGCVADAQAAATREQSDKSGGGAAGEEEEGGAGRALAALVMPSATALLGAALGALPRHAPPVALRVLSATAGVARALAAAAAAEAGAVPATAGSAGALLRVWVAGSGCGAAQEGPLWPLLRAARVTSADLHPRCGDLLRNVPLAAQEGSGSVVDVQVAAAAMHAATSVLLAFAGCGQGRGTGEAAAVNVGGGSADGTDADSSSSAALDELLRLLGDIIAAGAAEEDEAAAAAGLPGPVAKGQGQAGAETEAFEYGFDDEDGEETESGDEDYEDEDEDGDEDEQEEQEKFDEVALLSLGTLDCVLSLLGAVGAGEAAAPATGTPAATTALGRTLLRRGEAGEEGGGGPHAQIRRIRRVLEKAVGGGAAGEREVPVFELDALVHESRLKVLVALRSLAV
jgi:hypothetical protein